MIEIDTELIRGMAEAGKRIDKRLPEAYRNIVIETGVITSAEGSARVKIGDTEVICGVKMDVLEPFADTPDEGVLMVNSEFVPLASPEFESGPPGEDSIELARVVDRTLRESKAIDFKKLCIKEKEKVWSVFVDIDVLDHCGNLIDAACLAATAALLDTRIPKLDEDMKTVYGTKTGSLPLNGKPIATTFLKIGNAIVADPILAEEHAMSARLTVGTIIKDDEFQFCAMQKGGTDGFTPEEIEKILDLAIEKSNELRKMV